MERIKSNESNQSIIKSIKFLRCFLLTVDLIIIYEIETIMTTLSLFSISKKI